MNWILIVARFTIALVVLSLMAGAGLALAQESQQENGQQNAQAGGWSGYLVLGGGATPDYEGSEDYQPIPFATGKIGYDDYYVELRGPGLRANVLPGGLLPFNLEFGPSIAYRGGRDDVDNDRIDDLRNIDGTIEMGAFAKVSTHLGLHDTDEVGFEVEFLADVGGEHEGSTISFGPSYNFAPTERLMLGFGLSATYASGNYNDTYFGIDADNAARSGLSTFDPDGGIKDVGVSVNAIYQWNEHWGVTGMAGLTQLVGDAADSPIVDDEGSATQGLVAAGILYRF